MVDENTRVIPTIAVIGRGIDDITVLANHGLMAFRCLLELVEAKRINIEPITTADEGYIPKGSRRRFHAILCRPSWHTGDKDKDKETIVPEFVRLEFVREVRANDRAPFYIATLSAAVSHIQKMGEGIEIIRSSDGGNADATAEITVYLAISLKRQIHFNVINMGFGRNVRYDSMDCRSLQGGTWTTVGSGNVARALIRRLMGLGLKRIIIWNRRMSEDKFREILRDFAICQIASFSSGTCFQTAVSSGPFCVIEGTQDKEYALKDADIVSIHAPLVEEGPSGTKHLINDDMIRIMKSSAVIVNTARHGIVDEEATIKALIAGKLFGFGSDVLEPHAEKDNAGHGNSKSLLWQAYCFGLQRVFEESGDSEHGKIFNEIVSKGKEWQSLMEDMGGQDAVANKKLNILLTPHIGGWTKDAENQVANEVIGKLLIKLGLGKDVNFYTPSVEERNV